MSIESKQIGWIDLIRYIDYNINFNIPTGKRKHQHPRLLNISQNLILFKIISISLIAIYLHRSNGINQCDLIFHIIL